MRHAGLMRNHYVHLHDAAGQILLTEVRMGRDAKGLEAVNVMRWRDESGHVGQDTHVRLALHVERGGELFIEQDGQALAVKVEPGDRFLHTAGLKHQNADPILQLPTF